MAVLDIDGRPAAAFTVAVPMQRMTQGYLQTISEELRGIVAAAAAELREVRYR